MHHEAHVGAVHAHPERIRGDDEVEPAGHEVVLHVGPLGVGEPGVVGPNLAADLVADEPRHVVALLPRADVDEARPGLLIEHGFECAALIVRRRRGLHGEGEVRPIEAGDDALGAVDFERGEDVVLHERRRRGREGDGRRVAHVVAGAGDLEVVGAEVVAPLADAVRLVHGEERDASLGERAEERLVAEPLGRDVDEPNRPAPQRVEPGPLLLDRHRRVEGDGRNPPPRQRIHLILHQRDERRDHHRHTVEQARRELVDERLPRPGRHHDERIVPGHDRGDGLALPPPERLEPEVLAERVVDGGIRKHGSSGRHGGRHRRGENDRHEGGRKVTGRDTRDEDTGTKRR